MTLRAPPTRRGWTRAGDTITQEKTADGLEAALAVRSPVCVQMVTRSPLAFVPYASGRVAVCLSFLVNMRCSVSQIVAVRSAGVETTLHTPEYSWQHLRRITVCRSISRPFPMVGGGAMVEPGPTSSCIPLSFWP